MRFAQAFLLSSGLLAAAEVITLAPGPIQTPTEADLSSLISKLSSKSDSIASKIESKSDSIVSKIESKSSSIETKLGGPNTDPAPTTTNADPAVPTTGAVTVSHATSPNGALATGIPMMAGGLVAAGLGAVAML